MRCVVFNGSGGNEIVSVESLADPPPAKFEVLIATEYAAVNPADVLQREGGGVGTAAGQLGVALGARVVANVRSASRREPIAGLGATVLGAPEVFEYVRELGGADTILELVGATHMHENLNALAPSGTIV